MKNCNDKTGHFVTSFLAIFKTYIFHVQTGTVCIRDDRNERIRTPRILFIVEKKTMAEFVKCDGQANCLDR